ncbi:hypothetical protein Sjap_003259 [Stephania japonica]|uniref:Uncharacterized protein n=1 Tax=Stephania japonica TaxID=461633 RepID=A0AAP0KQ57_9MAGN
MSSRDNYTTIMREREVVRALLPAQEHKLPLSNLDWLLPSVDVSVFFCYYNPKDTWNENFNPAVPTVISTLKKALANTLVHYYPFAGELSRNPAGELELLCNNQGVDFIKAYADVKLKELNLHKPDVSVEGKLVPERKQGVLCIQVTKLQCGGLVVGCTFDHRIADAFSANMFLLAWAEITRGKPVSHLPTFDRSLLRPRQFGHYDKSIDGMYEPLSTPLMRGPNDHHPASRIYYIDADTINQIHSLANRGNSIKGHMQKSKLESFTAFLWQVFAGRIGNEKAKRIKMGIIVDGRTRIAMNHGEEGEQREIHHHVHPICNYIGNVLSIPFGDLSINDIMEKPLSSVADEVQEFLSSALTKEHFTGLIDWVEVHRPKPTLARIYCTSSSGEEVAFVVSSGLRFPLSRVDFGWGRPALGSYHFSWESSAGYVMPMPSPSGNGDWIVYMHCTKDHLEYLEEEVCDVFKPMSSHYLNLES